MTPGAAGDECTWLGRLPGLPWVAAGLIARRDELLARADRRAERMLRTSLVDAGILLRVGELAVQAAPRMSRFLLRRGEPEDLMEEVAQLALGAGPTYVKLGQLIASSRGLVPERFAAPFAACRDAVPPAPPASVRRVLRLSGIEGKLRHFDDEPVASASVAQVHRAQLLNGRDVAVKVRRPGITSIVAADAAYLLPALRLAERHDPTMRMANLSGAFELMVRLLGQEVDLRLEAANIIEMALAFENLGIDVRIPAPIPGFLDKRVLVMEYVDGVPFADAEAVERTGHDGAELVRVLSRVLFEPALSGGIFHGDLHPGNVLVCDDGLALLDHGIVGRLDVRQRSALRRLVPATVGSDRMAMLQALRDFGVVPADADLEALAEAMPDMVDEAEIREMLRDRRKIGERLGMIQRDLALLGFQIVPELALLGKNIVYLGDAMERHAPDIDVITESIDLVARLGVMTG